MAGANAPDFGAQLRRLRLAAHLSQEQLAEQAGLSRRGIQDLERGARRLPHPSTVQRLARALGAEPTELVRGRGRVVLGPSNLPAPLTSFVGRERETTSLRQRVQSTRLVTLTGPGGIGKTRLALRTAEDLR